MQFLQWNVARRASIVAALCAATGCGDSGPPIAPVEGVVTLDGTPLQGALVEFQPQIGSGSPSYGETNATGKYEMLFSQTKMGALVGDHLVRISTFNENERQPERLPSAYHAESQIVRTVEKGKTNVFDFAIEAGKPPVQPKPSQSADVVN